RELLALRSRYAALFEKGDYVPLAVEGRRRTHVLAFRRQHGNERLLVAVPLRVDIDSIAAHSLLPSGQFWGGTRIREEGRWQDVLLGQPVTSLRCADLFAQLPLAVLVSVPPGLRSP
ncbi:MAG: malto-oligosyltrehalose synthase, partial [Alphaproteobacteria bacterium]|nr:malto-oligosyltrehalose synthase [Alphaproteobacteria bacterium]